MSRHTPGPWEYHAASNYLGFSIAPKGILPTLAAVERPRGNPETCNVTCFNFPGEAEANARLIAAAPELLATLEDMVAYFGDPEWNAAAATCDHARELIAKVKGVEP